MVASVSPFVRLGELYEKDVARAAHSYLAEKCKRCSLFNGGMCQQVMAVDGCVRMAVEQYRVSRGASVPPTKPSPPVVDRYIRIPAPKRKFESLEAVGSWLADCLNFLPDDLAGLDTDSLVVTIKSNEEEQESPKPVSEEDVQLMERLRLKMCERYMESRDALIAFSAWLGEKYQKSCQPGPGDVDQFLEWKKGNP